MPQRRLTVRPTPTAPTRPPTPPCPACCVLDKRNLRHWRQRCLTFPLVSSLPTPAPNLPPPHPVAEGDEREACHRRQRLQRRLQAAAHQLQELLAAANVHQCNNHRRGAGHVALVVEGEAGAAKQCWLVGLVRASLASQACRPVACVPDLPSSLRSIFSPFATRGRATLEALCQVPAP